MAKFSLFLFATTLLNYNQISNPPIITGINGITYNFGSGSGIVLSILPMTTPTITYGVDTGIVSTLTIVPIANNSFCQSPMIAYNQEEGNWYRYDCVAQNTWTRTQLGNW